MARLRLSLLGGFEARLDGGPLLDLPAKAQALLAYLALRSGQAHSRHKLAALLWAPPATSRRAESAAHPIHDSQRHCQRRTGGTRHRGADGGPRAAALDVDALLFEALVKDGTPESLERAVSLYRGVLLDGVSLDEPPFDEWLIAERERLRELAIESLARLLAHVSKAGSTQRAIQIATHVLALDPLQEAVHRTLMRLYARQGRRGAALKQYQTCAEVLKRELGAEPEIETRQFYQYLLELRDAGGPGIVDAAGVAPESRPTGRGAGLEPAPQEASRRAGTSEDERKHITVLFADLKGSMELVLDRDPEEARALLDPALDGMIAAVRRFGGTVNGMLGDGLMALFGAPRSQEDHAVRACYAALSMQEAVTRYSRQLECSHGLEVRYESA